ncbi:hypothetical protein [Streptomyces sp. Ac-502]|uniref:hypothetical protein n=1 Tax=Streptomyces sp. Ac-502 TaxID=3342801 RepID=UPI0038623A0F
MTLVDPLQDLPVHLHGLQQGAAHECRPEPAGVGPKHCPLLPADHATARRNSGIPVRVKLTVTILTAATAFAGRQTAYYAARRLTSCAALGTLRLGRFFACADAA